VWKDSIAHVYKVLDQELVCNGRRVFALDVGFHKEKEAMSTTPELPPLPDQAGDFRDSFYEPAYSADQMRAYGAACTEEEMNRCLRLVYGHAGSDNDAERIAAAIRAREGS
jgi:hypothetical protein